MFVIPAIVHGTKGVHTVERVGGVLRFHVGRTAQVPHTKPFFSPNPTRNGQVRFCPSWYPCTSTSRNTLTEMNGMWAAGSLNTSVA